MNKLVQLVTATVNFVLSIFQGVGSKLPFTALRPPQAHRKEFSLEVVRPDDLLVLTLDFYNLQINSTAGSPQLGLIGGGDGFIVAYFPPQSFGEQAFLETHPGPSAPPPDTLLPPPVASRISGPSHLVFRLTPTLLPLDFTLAEILAALGKSETLVQPTFRDPGGIPAVGAVVEFDGQRSLFTAIEAPYRIVLSPNLTSSWQHAPTPVTNPISKRTELWHSRLSDNATAGAVWSPDFPTGDGKPPPLTQKPFRMSLASRYRHEIVRSSADRHLTGARPLDVKQLMLSSQGAWLSVHGQWSTELDLVEWRHIMTGGRDQYARIVEEGYLVSLGHRAVIVTITERKVQMGTSGLDEGKPVAYLRQRKLIFVREPTRAYQHRHIPFRTATIKTLVTPNLDDPQVSEILPGEADNAFWPRVAGENFLFHVVATDWEGREIEFHKPLAFVIKSTADAVDKTKLNKIINLYNGIAETDERRTRSMGGQKIAFAPTQKPGDTSLETAAMIFGAAGANGAPSFLPMMTKAMVDVPAVRQISGNTSPSTIAFDQKFVLATGNVIGNMGDVFAYLVDNKRTPVSFPPDKTGGMVAPNFDISGLSRGFGPVGGDISQFAGGNFNPTDIFKGINILGGIDLGSIISSAINANPVVAGTKIPQLKTVRTTAIIGGVSKNVIETSYRWNVDSSFLLKTGMFKPKQPGAEFFIETIVDTPLDGSPPVFTVNGTITKFAVVLLPNPPDPEPKRELVGINFDSVSFSAGTNKKVDFAIVFNSFEFLGPLTFVNKLRDVIPMDGLRDPPFLDVILPPNPQAGVTVGFSQGVPTVGVGIFSLENLSFSASFYLPFISAPANLRLAFCERHQPFTLTVSLLGGGGFFAIDIGMDGVRQIEAALEFGASVALNLGVASGSATVMGGVYYQKSGTGFAVSAYVRAAGSLSVLGIITVSVELYVSLNYQSDKLKDHGGKLWGQASVTVKIKIAFFSKSVSISIEREFAGSDPKFIDTVAPSDWSEYCGAFADYPA